jgi:hypothetical protein
MKTFCAGLVALITMLGLGLPAFGQAPRPDPLVLAAVETAQKQYNASFIG